MTEYAASWSGGKDSCFACRKAISQGLKSVPVARNDFWTSDILKYKLDNHTCPSEPFTSCHSERSEESHPS